MVTTSTSFVFEVKRKSFFSLASRLEKNGLHLYVQISTLVVLTWIHPSRQVGYVL